MLKVKTRNSQNAGGVAFSLPIKYKEAKAKHTKKYIQRNLQINITQLRDTK